MMRLLVLTPTCPFPATDGVHLRVQNVLRRLPTGWKFDLLCFDRVEAVRCESLPEPFSGELVRAPFPAPRSGWRGTPLGRMLSWSPPLLRGFTSTEMASEVRRMSAGKGGVLAFGLQLAQYLNEAPTGTPTALDNYNVESRILRRLADLRTGVKRTFWLVEASRLRRAERQILGRAHHVFAISEVDRAGMLELAPAARISTVPMGIDLHYFQANAGPPQSGPPCFTFVGAFNWHVNEAAAEWLCREAWPLVRRQLPDAQLRLVGRDPSLAVQALAGDPSITVTGTVPDVRPFLLESTGVLVPLRYGSGVRTKILEAFAIGRPVVSTPVGCEGLSVHHGGQLLIADDAHEFAGSCVRLAREPHTAAKLVAGALEFARDQDRQATEQLRTALSQAFGSADSRSEGALAGRGAG